MANIKVGVLTVSDRCFRKAAIDESGPNLVSLIEGGLVENGSVAEVGLVPDDREEIKKMLTEWSAAGLDVILTTGGTGLSKRDVTPEATAEVCEKIVPGISWQMMQQSLQVTSLASLSRSVAGFRGKTLIVNLPGSKKASQECLQAIAEVIPHSVDLINDRKSEIQRVHGSFQGKKSSVKKDNVAGRKRESPYPMISVEKAQKIVVERVYILRKEKVIRYEKAHGLVLAQDVVSRENHPPFDASLKDGYAVLSTDNSTKRYVMGVSNAGVSPSQPKVIPNHCVRISTGAALPPGADAVLQIEDTKLYQGKDTNEHMITLLEFPKKGQDVRPKGSDFKMGELLLPSGTYLDPAALGLVAAAGIVSVRVFQKPLVAVISTGDELSSPEEKLKPGKVRDSNRVMLTSLLREENMPTLDCGIVRDNPDDLLNVLERSFQTADVVVTTGSMSMGERDYLKEILESDFGAEICFGRVFMKPGKPTAFGILTFEGKPKLWFGLPGNPASALVTSHLFLLPALRRISGQEDIFPMEVTATLADFPALEDRPHYARGILKWDKSDKLWRAQVINDQRSSRVGSCVNANCLLELPTQPKTTTNRSYSSGTHTSACSSSFVNDLPRQSRSQNSSGSVQEFISGSVKAFLIGKTLRA